MDGRDDNNANNSGAVNSTQPGVFTPNQTPQPANQPQAQNSVVTGSVVEPASATGPAHPYFSNHPTQTFSSAQTGDIIVGGSAPAPKKKNKKLLIIAAAVVALLVVLIIVIVVMQGAKHPSGSNLSSLESEFNQYANYLLFGEKKNRLDGEFEPYRTYTFDQQLSSSDTDEAYWNEAATLLGNVSNSLNSSDIAYKAELLNALKNYRASFDFMRAYHQITEPTEDALLQAYLTSGAKGVNDYLDNFYARISDLDSSIADQYVEFKKQQYNLATEKFEIYTEVGCIRNGKMIAENCNQGTIPDAAATRFLEATNVSNAAMDKSNTLVQSTTQFLKSYCWNFSSWLHNPSQYVETEEAE